MKIFLRLCVTAFTLLVVTRFVPGIEVAGVYPALIAALFLGILNAVVRPVLIVLTLPITILTLGIFIFVINAGIFLFVASFVDGFVVTSFLSALIGSVIVSIMSGIASTYIK